MKRIFVGIAVFLIGLLLGLLLWFAPMGWPKMFEWLSPSTARTASWIIIILMSLLAGGLIYFPLRDRLHPIKLKVKELICWRIERQEPEHHAFHHCHEYNFHGQITLIPRSELAVIEFYLEIQTNIGLLKVNTIDELPKFISKKPITNMFLFQIKLYSETKVPQYGIIRLKLNRGKANKKVIIKLDDEYRPIPRFMSRSG